MPCTSSPRSARGRRDPSGSDRQREHRPLAGELHERSTAPSVSSPREAVVDVRDPVTVGLGAVAVDGPGYAPRPALPAANRQSLQRCCALVCDLSAREPTTIPSASAATVTACSGVEIPKPA